MTNKKEQAGDGTYEHVEMKKMLAGRQGKTFVANFTRCVYDWAYKVKAKNYNYRIYNEFTIRYEQDDGKEKKERYLIDSVLLIQPSYRALARGDCYTVGIELKGNRKDLMADDKMQMYVGWTDYMLLGVPTNLLEDAKEKIAKVAEAYPDTKGKIGILNIETGGVTVMPQRINVDDKTLIKVYEQILYNYMNKINKNTTAVSFDLQDIDVTPATLADRPDEMPTVMAAPAVKDGAKVGEIEKKNVLTDEERAARRQTYLEGKARQEAEAGALRAKNRTLTDKTREKLGALSVRDQMVFWTVRDAGEEGTDRKAIAPRIEQTDPGVGNALRRLTEAGLIEYDGGRKYGKYKVAAEARKSARCLSCIHAAECQGDALKCMAYQPATEDGGDLPTEEDAGEENIGDDEWKGERPYAVGDKVLVTNKLYTDRIGGGHFGRKVGTAIVKGYNGDGTVRLEPDWKIWNEWEKRKCKRWDVKKLRPYHPHKLWTGRDEEYYKCKHAMTVNTEGIRWHPATGTGNCTAFCPYFVREIDGRSIECNYQDGDPVEVEGVVERVSRR